MNIVILAAGKGTRMRSELPKVLHPVAGMPMLGHVIRTALALAPSRIILVVGHGADQVRAWADETPILRQGAREGRDAVSIHWALQDPPKGTGHAVQQAIPFLLPDVPTLILYGDVPLITSETLSKLKAEALRHNGMALLTAALANPFGYGRIVRNTDGEITAVVEEKDASPEVRSIREINTGILMAPTPALVQWLGRLTNHNSQQEFYLTDIIAMASKDKQPIGSVMPKSEDEILGVNSQPQRADIERRHQRQLAQELMDQGVRIMDPERIDIRGSLRCAQDVSIDVGCVFEGDVVIGAGTTVGPYCIIRNSQIDGHVQIEAFSTIDQAVIGPKAVVGPYARIRPGSRLGEGAHVGNFVELKNTELGPRSKANHLSYLGDATIGARVNIGAGTITCNYDGAEKHRTVIEDDAFIGSDTQLVAPVTVGKGATLGAGTTLTQDAPAKTLTLSRSPQVSLKTYQRPHKKAH